MKKSLIIATLMAMTTFWNCSKEKTENVDPENNEINFNAYVESSTKAIITNNDYFIEFDVYGYQTPEDYIKTNDLGSAYIDNEYVHQDYESKSWIHDKKYTWSEDNEKTHFFAVSPINILSKEYKTHLDSYPTFEYTVESGVKTQKDLIASSLINQTKSKDNKNVDLEFKHILSQINFSLRGEKDTYTYTITQIELQNIKNKGTFAFAENNSGLWSNLEGTESYSLLDENETFVLTDNEYHKLNLEINNDKTLIILPQKNTENAKIKITYSVKQIDTKIFEGSKEIDLNAFSWDINSNNRYNITLPINEGYLIYTNDISNWEETVPREKRGLTLNKTELTIAKQKKETLIAKLTPNNKDYTFEWTSSNDDIVTVDDKGVIEAIEVGKDVKITVSALDTKKRVVARAICIVNVNETISIPDEKFIQALIDEGVDVNKDGEISAEEAFAVRILEIKNKDITSLAGIEYFKALSILDCSENKLESLDISKNTTLTDLNCSKTEIKSLDVSKNTNLLSLKLDYTHVESLDLCKNTKLSSLSCSNTNIEYIDISECTDLLELMCSNTKLTFINTDKNTKLKNLYCSNSKIISLDLSENKELDQLYCNNLELKSLDLSANTKLTRFNCSYTNITTLDLSKLINLKLFYSTSTDLKFIDVSKNTKLELIYLDECLDLEIIYVWQGFNVYNADFHKTEKAKYVEK